MKSSAARQKAHLPTALASLNNGHNSDLRACCAGLKSLSRLSFVPIKPLCPRSTTWRSSLVANLSSTVLGRAPTTKVEARTIASHCCMVATTLARNLIWPYNNSMFSHYTNSFLISPSLASKPVKRKLSLCSSYLGVSARASTTRLTTWRMFLAITVVHLGSSAEVALDVIATAASRSISWLIARLPTASRDTMFLMAASILKSHASTGELSILRPMTSQCLAKATW